MKKMLILIAIMLLSFSCVTTNKPNVQDSISNVPVIENVENVVVPINEINETNENTALYIIRNDEKYAYLCESSSSPATARCISKSRDA